MQPTADPGYGDPNAPIGTAEWAKRWRLCFQTEVKQLSRSPKSNAAYYDLGEKHQAWTLLTDEKGSHFKTWAAFCAYRQPYGLGTDPAEFEKFVKPAMGEKAFDLMTVSPGSQGERTDLGETSPDERGKLSGHTKRETLRAILRAPEVVQQLYRDGLITQTIAAKLGPKSPTPEQAARVAEARQAIEAIDRTKTPAAFRAEVKRVVVEVLGVTAPSTLDILRRAWAKATADERTQFLQEIHP